MQIPLGVTLETALCVQCDTINDNFSGRAAFTECVHCEVQNEYIYIIGTVYNHKKAVPWLWLYVAGFSPRIPRFDSRSVHVWWTLEQVFLRVLLFSPVSIIPPMFHTHLHLHVALTRSLGTSQQAMLFQTSCSIGYDSSFTFFSSQERSVPFPKATMTVMVKLTT
jgi:hypothetical protein